MLIALRNTIKAHRSLYLKKNILYKNVLKNNIIIINLDEIDNFSEILIDLNFAKVLDSERNNVQHQRNIIKFIIIKVLRDIDYTYRHNFKLFFYVLL